LISAPENEGTCLVEIRVDETLINAKQVVHGGALASLIDAVSTIALFNTPNQKPGVSVDMNISYDAHFLGLLLEFFKIFFKLFQVIKRLFNRYLRSAVMNDMLLVEARVVKSGGKIAFLKADIYIKENDSFVLNKDKLVACGTHTKYVV